MAARSRQQGSAVAEMLVVLVFLMIVFYLTVVNVVVPAIEEHERRYVESITVPID
jgi:Tfp pilus assembly protein FimT